jgi:biopolymer transport protein ExbD
MRSRRFRSHGDGIYEPNMTPLIDVSLVLVVILMVATPLAFQSAIAVKTAASSGKPSAARADVDRIEIEIQADGALLVNRTQCTRENLAVLLANRIGASRSRTVVIHCAAGVSHGMMVAVLDEARSAGAAQIALTEI